LARREDQRQHHQPDHEKGFSTVVVTSTFGGYQAYPLAPIMGFVTLQAKF
jgi:hypothetical protein